VAGAGAAFAAANAQLLAADPLPTIILGKTGQRVSRLGMGTSWDVAPSFVQASLAAGVLFIDTAEGYENGNSERRVGEVLARTGKRKDVFLVTKTQKYNPKADPKSIPRNVENSLQNMQTDYIDGYYMHGMTGARVSMLNDPAVKAVFEGLKKAGKIRFAGLSCHDKELPRVVETAAACGWIDQIMIQYNYRTMGSDDVRRAVDKASKANLGLICMKSQGGAGSFKEVAPSPKYTQFIEKGFKPEMAAIKTVFTDERFHVVVSEMTNRDMLRDNTEATRQPLSAKEARLLEEHRQKTAHLYCHGCGHLCETAAKGVPVATVLRYFRYYEVYGKREQARELYQALPAEARALADADLKAAQAACPHGLPVVDLVTKADRLMS
jgi:predicted aldo/keto reductase-like oxidoreductase